MDAEKLLEDRITQNLAAVEYDGPQQVFGELLIPILVQLVAQVMTNCFGNLTLGSKVNIFQKAALKRELIREVYDGKPKEFRRMEGKKVLKALVKSAEEATPEEVEAVQAMASTARMD